MGEWGVFLLTEKLTLAIFLTQMNKSVGVKNCIVIGPSGYHSKGYWSDCSDLSLAMKEIEAETVSYLVCERANIQTRSAQYLMEYIQAEQIANIDINRIMAATQKVEARTDTLTESNAVLKPKQEPSGQMSIFGRTEVIDLPLLLG